MFTLACVRKVLGGSTHEEGSSRLAVHLTEWYKKVKCRSRIKGLLTLKRSRSDNGWAKLKAHGAGVRHLVPYVLHLLVEFGNVHDPLWGHHDQLAQRIYEIVTSESSVLTSAAKKRN